VGKEAGPLRDSRSYGPGRRFRVTDFDEEFPVFQKGLDDGDQLWKYLHFQEFE